jgi:hypothetical protein
MAVKVPTKSPAVRLFVRRNPRFTPVEIANFIMTLVVLSSMEVQSPNALCVVAVGVALRKVVIS